MSPFFKPLPVITWHSAPQRILANRFCKPLSRSVRFDCQRSPSGKYGPNDFNERCGVEGHAGPTGDAINLLRYSQAPKYTAQTAYDDRAGINPGHRSPFDSQVIA